MIYAFVVFLKSSKLITVKGFYELFKKNACRRPEAGNKRKYLKPDGKCLKTKMQGDFFFFFLI